jgi:hypothetical protein
MFGPMLPYFWHGLDSKEKCMYIFNSHLPEVLCSAFAHSESHADDSPEKKQLQMYSQAEVYTKDGTFDPERMISLLSQNIADSLQHGFAGMRAAAEMDWVLSTGTSISTLLEYETKLNTFYPESKLIGVCQFDERKFSPDALIGMISTHPYIILYGKLYENKYFYTNPKYTSGTSKIQAEDYATMVSVILDDEPLIA